MTRTSNWICNVSKENLNPILDSLKNSLIWKNRPQELNHWLKPIRTRLYLHGRNPNRKQFRDSYRGNYSGTNTLRKEHSTYFGVYCDDPTVASELREHLLEISLLMDLKIHHIVD